MGVKKTYSMVINPLFATVVYSRPLIWKNMIPASARAQMNTFPTSAGESFTFLIQKMVGRQTISAIAKRENVTDMAPSCSSPYLLPMKPAPHKRAVNVASTYPVIVPEKLTPGPQSVYLECNKYLMN